MVSLKLFSTGELVRHFIFHTIDVFIVDLHFFVHSALQIADFLEICLARINLHLKRSCRAFSFIQLALLEVEILLHLFDLIDSGQGGLPIQVLAHMLQQSRNSLLRIRHLSRHLLLLSLVFLSKLIDLLLFLIEHFKLLFSTHATGSLWTVTQLALDILDVAIVLVDHLTQIANLLVLLLDFRIILLNTIHETLSSFWEWQIVLIALKLQVIFALLKLGFFLAQVLSPLLQ